MSVANPNSLLSGRAQDRLSQLQRALTVELRALNSQQSLLLGALQACDLGTQSALLQEYLQRVEAVSDAVGRLRVFVGRHVYREGEADPLVQGN
jgi:hypothetical protein